MVDIKHTESGPSGDAVALMRYDASKKSVIIAYLFWFFLGWIGGHRFYLGLTTSAIFLIFLPLLSLICMTAQLEALGFIALAIWAVWVLIDALLIPGMVSGANTRLIAQIQR